MAARKRAIKKSQIIPMKTAVMANVIVRTAKVLNLALSPADWSISEAQSKNSDYNPAVINYGSNST